MKSRTQPSPFMFKTYRRAKVQNVKCFLRAYQTRAKNPVTKQLQPFNILFWEVKASDGSYFKTSSEEAARARFEKLIEFEKKQTFLRL